MLRLMYLWLDLFIFPCLLELKIKHEDPFSICEKTRISFISPLNYNYSIRENKIKCFDFRIDRRNWLYC